MKNSSPLLRGGLSLLIFLCLHSHLLGQSTTIEATFEADLIGELPALAPGSGDKPTAMTGDFANTMVVAEVSGNVGNSTAAGKVVSVDIAQSGKFSLLDFEGLLNSGIIERDTVWVGFDFLVEAGTVPDGFAFLRCYDETEESFADVGFSFLNDGFTVGLLDYDPATGNYLGWREPAFPNNFFQLGTWHRFELVVDLSNNVLRLMVDGNDYGIAAGISRATGLGYAGAFFNWGGAFKGKAAIDNVKVRISDRDQLPMPPAGFDALVNPADRGGEVLRLPCGDFRQKGIDWDNTSDATLIYSPVYQGVSAYRVLVGSGMEESDRRLFSFKSLPIKANRTYEVSALIRSNFPRDTWEISVGIQGADANNDLSLGARYGGLPAVTAGPDGWQRWTWRFTPHWDDRYGAISAFLGIHEYGPGFDGNVLFEIADLAFVELPAETLTAFAPGEGVTFPGGAGDLPMQVEGVSQTGNILQVTVTGATYEFNLTTNSLKAFQRIDAERLLTEVTTLPLSGLKVQSQNDQVVVLVGDNLTIGVQMDGVLVISPHQNMQATIESVLGGDFNRYSGGDLLSSDDFGGFTANIHMPKGTGLLPQMSMLTTGLDFPNFLPDDLASRGSAESGWKAQADLRPGERLFLSVFPTRPYDWAKSFDHNWGLSDYNATLDYDNPPYMKNWILWNINQRGWAMSFGERYEIRPNVPYQDHFDAITAEGDKWSAYFSQWFYYSRDPVEWVNEIKRWRDEYNMGAIYSDGLAQDDWLSAYEAMRRLREEVFPSGNIIIHDSYPQSGVASAGYRPFIYAYATSTYMGENAEAAGEDWAWARYAICQFRRGNSLGVIKGDQWAGFQSVQRYLLSLVWGGRGIPDVLDYESTYLPILNQLKTLWETYGNDPFFFDRYYHPEAQNLTGYNIGRAGMPILQLDTIRANEIRVTASTWTPSADLYYTIDGSEPTINSLAYTTPIIWDGQQNLRFRALRADLDESRIADLGERSNTPLPVELLRFVAIEEKGNARLNWQTALEINNEKFEIEHSLDGKNFQKIGKQTGQGNSVVTQHYTFTHEQPPGGLNYYRLKQIDFNGAANHSLIESVFIDAKGAFNYRVYPNPGSTFVRLEGNIEGQQVDLFDSKGQFIRSFQPSSTSLNISLEGLSSGLYLLKVTDRATHQHSWQRFLKD